MVTNRRASESKQPPQKPISVEVADSRRRGRSAVGADKEELAAKRSPSDPELSARERLRSSIGEIDDGSASKPPPGFYTDCLSQSTVLPMPHSAPTLKASSTTAAVAAKQAGSRFLYLKSDMREKGRAWRAFEENLEQWECMHAGAVFGDGSIRMDYITNKVADEVRLDLQKRGVQLYFSLDPPPPTSVPAPPLPLPSPAPSQAAKAKPVGPLPSLPQTTNPNPQPPTPKPQTPNPKPQTSRSPDTRLQSTPPPTHPRLPRACSAASLPGAQPDRSTGRAAVSTLVLFATARQRRLDNKTARISASASSPPRGVAKRPPQSTSGFRDDVEPKGARNVVQSKEYRCLHGRRRGLCVECGGGSICEHGRQKHW